MLDLAAGDSCAGCVAGAAFRCAPLTPRAPSTIDAPRRALARRRLQRGAQGPAAHGGISDAPGDATAGDSLCGAGGWGDGWASEMVDAAGACGAIAPASDDGGDEGSDLELPPATAAVAAAAAAAAAARRGAPAPASAWGTLGDHSRSRAAAAAPAAPLAPDFSAAALGRVCHAAALRAVARPAWKPALRPQALLRPACSGAARLPAQVRVGVGAGAWPASQTSLACTFCCAGSAALPPFALRAAIDAPVSTLSGCSLPRAHR